VRFVAFRDLAAMAGPGRLAELGAARPTVHDQPYGRLLVSDELACAVCSQHELEGDAVDLETFLRTDHLLISPTGDGRGTVDARLAALGTERRIRLTTPAFLAAPLIVASTSLLLTARRLLEFLCERAPLRILDPPPELTLPVFDIGILWHPRLHNDEGHRWFRSLVARSL
jgi:DNA-binding transcriptional LysR family regulator